MHFSLTQIANGWTLGCYGHIPGKQTVAYYADFADAIAALERLHTIPSVEETLLTEG